MIYLIELEDISDLIMILASIFMEFILILKVILFISKLRFWISFIKKFMILKYKDSSSLKDLVDMYKLLLLIKDKT